MTKVKNIDFFNKEVKKWQDNPSIVAAVGVCIEAKKQPKKMAKSGDQTDNLTEIEPSISLRT